MIWTITIDGIEDDCNIDIEKDEDDMLMIATIMMMIELLLCRHLPTLFPQSNLSRYTIRFPSFIMMMVMMMVIIMIISKGGVQKDKIPLSPLLLLGCPAPPQEP